MLKKFFCLIMCAFFISGCTYAPNVEEITFSSWGSVTEVQILKKIITDFEQENPQIKIKFMHIPQNYFQKIHLLFASNTAPDVVFINNIYLPQYSKYLLDLSDFAEKEAFYSQALNGLSFENKILAIPRDISNLVFYANTNLVSVKEVCSLEELLTAVKNMNKKDVFAISFEEDVYYLLPYLAYFGEVFDENFLPEKSKGYHFYLALRDEYKIAPKKSQVGSLTQTQMFLDGKIALYLSGRWMYPIIKEKADFNWKIIPFPLGEGLLPADSSGWAISKKTKHKDAALKFVEYLSSEKSAEKFAETGLVIPARIKASSLLNEQAHNEKVFLDMIKHSQNTFIPKDYKKLVDQTNMKF